MNLESIIQKMENTLDEAAYRVHAGMAAIADRYLGIDKFTVSKLTTLAGIAASNTFFAASVANAVYYKGSWAQVALSGIVDVAYCVGFFRQNLKRADFARERETYLHNQDLQSVPPYELALNRMRNKGVARWYALGEVAIPIISYGTRSLNNPAQLISMAGLMASVAAIYGARYTLLAPALKN